VVICLERDADLHMAQLMPLPLTVSCFSKIQIVFTFLVRAYPGSPGQRAVKRMCVCVCLASGIWFINYQMWVVAGSPSIEMPKVILGTSDIGAACQCYQSTCKALLFYAIFYGLNDRSQSTTELCKVPLRRL